MTSPYRGNLWALAAMLETTFRTPPASPVGSLLKFDTLTFGSEETRQDNNTINGNPLPNKRDAMDSHFMATGEHVFCLNDIGYWLTLLWGVPVTTGTGPYVHTYTLDQAERPSAQLELALLAGGTEFRRALGAKLNEISWDVMDTAGIFKTSLLGGAEVQPAPGTALYTAPTAQMALSRACTKGGAVYDVNGSSTLGDIGKASVTIKNDLQGYALADANEGYGSIYLGQPMIEVAVSGLFNNGSLFQAAEANTSKKLVLSSKNAAGTHSLLLTLPNVEFDRPKTEIKTSKGMLYDLKGRAHFVTGAAAPTIVLTNAIATYA